jgi:hypothetical protein
VIVGTLMFRNVREVNWDYFGDAVPAFLTILTIPLTYKYAHYLSDNLTRKKLTSTCSIAYGVIAGVSSYILINGVTGLLRKVTGGRMVPPSHVNAEAWNTPHWSIVPVWVFVLILSHCLSPLHLIVCFHRKYMHGYITNQPYTPPDYTDDPRHSASVRTHSSEDEKGSRAIDFAGYSEN